MRFTIKQAGCGSERVGCLTGFAKSSSVVLETPTSALFTQGGSVVHLTADVLMKVFSSPQLLWVPLSNSIQLELGVTAQGEGIAKFAGLPGHITCTTLNDLNQKTPGGHFEPEKVPLWTKNGKKMITANRYMDLMEVFKPDLILAIADSHTSLSEGPKRIVKSVDRTCSLLDTCVKHYMVSKELQKSSLIGVVVGVSQPHKCEECIKNILKHKEYLGGVLLGGITDSSEACSKVSPERLTDIFKNISAELPTRFLRIVEGCWNPAVVVAAIENGWDVFDGSYPLQLTNAGHALNLNFDVDRHSDELCILDLNDIRYKEDFRPILQGCICLACKKHTRAYIRHLLNTREMLANVLLSIHNLHHFDQMFLFARRHIITNTFQIYKRHITKQYELYETSKAASETTDKVVEAQATNVIQENGVTSEKNVPCPLKKKIRVSNIESIHNKVDSETAI